MAVNGPGSAQAPALEAAGIETTSDLACAMTELRNTLDTVETTYSETGHQGTAGALLTAGGLVLAAIGVGIESKKLTVTGLLGAATGALLCASSNQELDRKSHHLEKTVLRLGTEAMLEKLEAKQKQDKTE